METVMTETAPFFSAPSDNGWMDADPGVRRRVRLQLPEMMIVEVEFQAGAVGAPHAHPHVQCCYVERGSFEVTIGDHSQTLPSGGCFIVPSGTRHGVRALEAGVLVDVFTPRRDDFLP